MDPNQEFNLKIAIVSNLFTLDYFARSAEKILKFYFARSAEKIFRIQYARSAEKKLDFGVKKEKENWTQEVMS